MLGLLDYLGLSGNWISYWNVPLLALWIERGGSWGYPRGLRNDGLVAQMSPDVVGPKGSCALCCVM